MARNIKIKARLSDLPAARRIARRLATERLGTQRQVDTYFHCRHGRLKLREIDGERAELVWYVRADQTEPGPSDYHLVPVEAPDLLKAALAGALGVAVVVAKEREIYLHQNVRIHLDRVEGLGEFLELEAVLEDGPEQDSRKQEAARALLQKLMRQLGIAASDLLESSYSDMLS